MIEVAPAANGGWVVQHNGIPVATFATKANATDRGRQLAKRHASSLTIHSQTGSTVTHHYSRTTGY